MEDLICNVVAYDLDAGQGQATNFDINQVRAYAAPASNVASHCFEGNNARFQLPDDANWYDGCISSGVQEGVDRAENCPMRQGDKTYLKPWRWRKDGNVVVHWVTSPGAGRERGYLWRAYQSPFAAEPVQRPF